MITFEQVSERLSYDPRSGLFKWITKHRGHRKQDWEAGSITVDGYIKICIDGKSLKAHRLAWLMIYGEWPVGVIDHINGIKTDNRICNLRQASIAENTRNQKISKANKSGFKGVLWNRRDSNWTVQVRAGGRLHFFGSFPTKEKANLIAIRAREELHGKFANHGEEQRLARLKASSI